MRFLPDAKYSEGRARSAEWNYGHKLGILTTWHAMGRNKEGPGCTGSEFTDSGESRREERPRGKKSNPAHTPEEAPLPR